MVAANAANAAPTVAANAAPTVAANAATAANAAPTVAANAANAAQDAVIDRTVTTTAMTVSLGRFYLRLVNHPRLLVCTRVGCTLGLPLMPNFRDITAHVQRFHHQPLGDASRSAIQALLTNLDLVPLKDVPVDRDQLPIPKIKELPVVTDGHQCNHCSYAIFARNAMYAHIKDKHSDMDAKATFTHPVLLQVIHESGRNRRYIYVQDKELDPTPPQAILNPNLDAHKLDESIKAKAAALLQKDQDALAKAGLLHPVVDTSMLSGNVGPWAKQLKWGPYWAGKPLAAIGALGTDTSRWPGAHRNFVHWLAKTTKDFARDWMFAFMDSGRYVQQSFRAYNEEPSQPYNLNPATIKKRGDTWSQVIALLAHLALDGAALNYHGIRQEDQHLVVTEEAMEAIHQLQDVFALFDDDANASGPFSDEDRRHNRQHIQEVMHAVEEALLNLSHLLITQG